MNKDIFNHKNFVRVKLLGNSLGKKIKQKPLLSILLLSLLIRIVYLLSKQSLWWDSHVYLSMGKHIFSSGNLGVWEAFRPLVHPIILGAFWKIGLDPLFVGKILDLIFSLTAIYLTYLVGKELFGRTVGLISSLIFSLSPLFIMFTGLIQTEPLAITLSLLGIYFFTKTIIKKDSQKENEKEGWKKDKNEEYKTSHKTKNNFKLFLAGLFLSLSFLTKFPQGIIFGVVFLVLLFKREKIFQKVKEMFFLVAGFSVPFLPYMIFNYFNYPNMFEPFTSGSSIVTTATWAYGLGISYYLTAFFLQNFIYFFYFGYIYYFFRDGHWKDQRKVIVFLIPLMFFAYFTFAVPRKEVRYLVPSLPFLGMMVSYIILKIYRHLKKYPRPYIKPFSFVIICACLVLIYVPSSLQFEARYEFKPEIIKAIGDHEIKGMVLASNPEFVSFLDQPTLILSSGMIFGPTIYEQQKGKYQLLIIDTCDLSCPPDDSICLEKKGQFINMIAKENKEIFKKNVENCTYSIHLPE